MALANQDGAPLRDKAVDVIITTANPARPPTEGSR